MASGIGERLRYAALMNLPDSLMESVVPRFGLIVIGDEILSGKRQDKHLPKAIALLSERGLGLAWARVIGDDPELITAALREAFEQARVQGAVVLCCGGIGATPDDHTRACAARALGVPLVQHEAATALILERMRDMAREAGVAFDPDQAQSAHRLNMAVFPQGADLIPNPYNKIAGFMHRFPSGGGVYFMPGFPVMAWPMMAWVLDTHHADTFHRHAVDELGVIVWGAMEATLTPLMLDIEGRFPGVKVYSLPSVDHPELGKHIDLGVKGRRPEVDEAYKAMLDALHERGVNLGPARLRRHPDAKREAAQASTGGSGT